MPSGPFALFLDVDGTLLDIAAVPDGVSVPPDLGQALVALDAGLQGAVALVSGRAIADLDAIFAPLELAASGVHGAEMRLRPGDPIGTTPAFRLPAEGVAALKAIAARYPGTLVEDKGFSVAIHYRAIPSAGPELRRDLEDWLRRPDGEGCRILPGHMVFEMKRQGFDKGTALDAFMLRPPFAGRLPIFIGDDVTDLPAFERAIAHGGLAYSVTTERDGTSGHFADPAEVRAWLSQTALLVRSQPSR